MIVTNKFIYIVKLTNPMKSYASLGPSIMSYGLPSLGLINARIKEHRMYASDLDGIRPRPQAHAITQNNWASYLDALGANGREKYVESLLHKSRYPENDLPQRVYAAVEPQNAAEAKREELKSNNQAVANGSLTERVKGPSAKTPHGQRPYENYGSYDNGNNYSQETFNGLARYFKAVANLFSRLRQGAYNMQTGTDSISKDRPETEGLEGKVSTLKGSKPILLSPRYYAVPKTQLELAS